MRPIDFSQINSRDLGYSTEEEWKSDVEATQTTFVSAFPEVMEAAKGVAARPECKIVMLKADEPVTSGAVVEVAVIRIIQTTVRQRGPIPRAS